MQGRRNSIANALELRLLCINPSKQGTPSQEKPVSYPLPRYRGLCDNATEAAQTGIYRTGDQQLLELKGQTIVNCYFNSEVPPKIQVGVIFPVTNKYQCLMAKVSCKMLPIISTHAKNRAVWFHKSNQRKCHSLLQGPSMEPALQWVNCNTRQWYPS